MEVELCFKSGRHAHSKLYLRASSTIDVKEQLQKLWNVKQRRWIISIAEHVGEKLLNPAIVKRIGVDDQRCSENMANLLHSELAECQVVTDQEMRFFWLRIRLRPSVPSCA